MMRWLPTVTCLLVLATPLAAQGRPTPERLRQQVIQRFMQNYRDQAGLTDEQFERFQTVATRSWEVRRGLEARERQTLRALEGQLRPGIAADQDSVSALIDALLALQEERVTAARADQDEYATFLSPVQRAQLVLAWTRLERQIEMIVRRRMEGRRNR